MTATADAARAKPYHHGDLRRALVDAAIVVLERGGPSALSLRAAAREAGVSAAAPYHHFKDKGDLLEAVAVEGFARLQGALGKASAQATGREAARGAIGVTYVDFARRHPALYRVMWETVRDRRSLPSSGGVVSFMRNRVRPGEDRPGAEVDTQLNVIATWCAAHGLAEICACEEYKPLIEALGGEEAFVRAVISQVGGPSREPAPDKA